MQQQEKQHEEAVDSRFKRSWTIDDVAWFLQVSVTKARQIVKTAEFSEPVVLPGGRLQRWEPTEIVRWWQQQLRQHEASEPLAIQAPETRPVGRPSTSRS